MARPKGSKNSTKEAVEQEAVAEEISKVEKPAERNFGEYKMDPKGQEVVAQIMTNEARAMKQALKSQKRVMIIIDKDFGVDAPTGHVDIGGEVYESYGEPQLFILNGYNFYVPKGVSVPVPESIAAVWNQNQKYTKDKMREATTRKTIKRLFSNQE